jgi:hypothetical protein
LSYPWAGAAASKPRVGLSPSPLKAIPNRTPPPAAWAGQASASAGRSGGAAGELPDAHHARCYAPVASGGGTLDLMAQFSVADTGNKVVGYSSEVEILL